MRNFCPHCTTDSQGTECDVQCEHPACRPCYEDRFVASLDPESWAYLDWLEDEVERLSRAAQDAEEGQWHHWRQYVAEAEAAAREADDLRERLERRDANGGSADRGEGPAAPTDGA